MFKLNDEKTEVILFTSKQELKSLPNIGVSVGGQQLRSSSVRDLGVIYNQHLSMTQHVNSYAELDITTSEISGGFVDTCLTMQRKHLFMLS